MSIDLLPQGFVKKHPIYPVWVSRDARLFRENSGEIKQRYNSSGYRIYAVGFDGKTKTLFTHKAVLETYVGGCPDGMQARHLNGIKDDNNLENLAWGTPAENGLDKKRHRYLLAKYIQKYGSLEGE